MSRLFRLAAGSSATNGWDDVAERLTAFQSTTSRRVYGPRSSRYLQLPRNAGKEQIYHRMVERLGLTLGDRRIWVVGDSVERDLHPAIGLGIQCIWARYGARVDPTDYAELLRVTPWEVGSELPALPTPPSGVQVADHFHDVVAITTGQFPLPRS